MTNNINRKITSIAPARVCLFGDHQDYLGLPIIACAIDRYIKIEGVKNNKDHFDIHLPDIGENFKILLNDKKNEDVQGDFLRSALNVLNSYGCHPNCGYDITVSGNIPINSGLSSSSALVVAWIRFLMEAFGINKTVTPELIAKLAYQAEVVEMKSSGGKMDQFTIAIGNTIYLETDGNSRFEKLNIPKFNLIIGESGVPKATGKVLAELKRNALKAIDYVKENVEGFEIRNAKISEIKNYMQFIPEHLRHYYEAAVLNYDVTKRAHQEFKSEKFQLEEIGILMNEHHNILKNKLDLTVPKIDAMIEAALSAGALGAKIVGSGRGGSIVAISNSKNSAEIVDAIKEAGAADAYQVSVANGAWIDK